MRLLSREHAQSANEIFRRNGLDALNQKSALGKEWCANANFKLRTTKSGRMRNDANQSPVCIRVWDADNECGTNLLRNSEIDEPDFAALRREAGPPRRPRRGTMQPPANRNPRQSDRHSPQCARESPNATPLARLEKAAGPPLESARRLASCRNFIVPLDFSKQDVRVSLLSSNSL